MTPFSPGLSGREQTGNAIIADEHSTTNDKNSTAHTSNPGDTNQPAITHTTLSHTALAVTENLVKIRMSLTLTLKSPTGK